MTNGFQLCLPHFTKPSIRRSDCRSSSQNPLELVVVVLAEAGGDEGAGLRGADGLTRAGFGEGYVPEVGIWRGEGDADEAAFALLAQRRDVALDGLGSHFIEDADILPWDQRRIHEQKGTVRADDISRGLQINGFAFGEAATHPHGNLEGKPNRAATFWVTGSLHMEALVRGQWNSR